MQSFAAAVRVKVRALYVGERIDARALEQTQRLASSPLAVPAGEHGVAIVFRYGVVVLCRMQALEEAAFMEALGPFIGEPFAKPEAEDAEIRVEASEAVEAGVVSVNAISVERLQLIAEILAKSVVLARSEALVRDSTTAVEGWARALERTGAGGSLETQLKKHLGATLVIQNNLAGRIEISDKPDLLWDHPDLERLHARLEDEYELKERDKTLDRKLALMVSTAEVLLNFVNTKQSNRLEWYIIGLIVVEIALTVFTLFTK